MVTMKEQYPTLYTLALEAARSSCTINSSFTEGDWHNKFVSFLSAKTPDYLDMCEAALRLHKENLASCDDRQSRINITEFMAPFIKATMQ